MAWKERPDGDVRHVWRNPHTNEDIIVFPTFYEDSGTPIDPDDGEDLVYVHTEVWDDTIGIFAAFQIFLVICSTFAILWFIAWIVS